MNRNRSIRDTLGKKFILALLLPIYLIIGISIIYMASSRMWDLRMQQSDLLDYTERVLSYEVETATRGLTDYYKAIEKGYIQPEDADRYLVEVTVSNPLLRDLLYLDETGHVLYTTNEREGKKGFDLSESNVFRNAELFEVLWSPAHLAVDDGKITFDIAYKGMKDHVIIGKFTPAGFQNLVSELAVKGERSVAVAAEDGVYLAHSDFDKVLNRSRELNMSMHLKNEGRSSTLFIDGRRSIVSVQKISGHSLYLITYTEFNVYYRPLLILAFGSVILVGLLSFFTLRYLRSHTVRIVGAMNELVELTGEVATGNYGYKVNINTYEELQKVIEHFNEMSDIIRENFRDLSDNSALLETLNEDLMLQNNKIRENEAQIEKILESTYDGVLLLGKGGRILRANNAVYELFEVPVEQRKNRRMCNEIFGHFPEVCGDSGDEVSRKLGINQHKIIEFKDRVIEEVTSTLYEEDAVIGHIKTYRDVTARKELERKVNRATKMEAIGRLTSGIAHDFNNILQVIVGYSELVYYYMEKENTPNQLLDKIKSINDAALRAEQLIRQLMTFSKMDQVQKRPVDINECVGDISKMLERVIGENIGLEMDFEEGLPQIMADKTQLEQIMVNLCVNSRDAIEGHGQIKIKTYETLRRSGCFVCLEISDTGRGMNKEVKEKIFEPFFTTKEIGKGTGLGLATVLGIVESHGGIIELESEPGLGTTFRIVFPNEKVISMTIDKSKVVASDVDFDGLHVLFIEDDTTWLGIHRNMLEAAGMRVSVASNGIEATERYRDNHENIDLVILDSIIPDIDAGRVLTNMKDYQLNVKVLMTTTYDDSFMSSAVASEDQLHFLRKPYNSHELIKAIAHVVYR